MDDETTFELVSERLLRVSPVGVDGIYPLVRTAASIVAGLRYLLELGVNLPAGCRQADVELAHARWAVIDVTTAVDVCVGALARLAERNRAENQEWSYRDSDRLAGVSECFDTWLAAIREDTELQTIRSLRHAAAHRVVGRSVTVDLGAATAETTWSVPGSGVVPLDALRGLALNVASRHVGAFFVALDAFLGECEMATARPVGR